MKATITASGNLKITPENELESWALKTWFESYNEIRSDCRSTLSVEDIVVKRGEPQEEGKIDG